MAENSRIEWCDHTFNPWRGCTKVSPACKNCYAMEHVNRYGGDFHGKRVVASETYWRDPLKWNKLAEHLGVRQRVFCASLADVFEDWDGAITNSSGANAWIVEYSGDWLFCDAEQHRRLSEQKGVRLLTLHDARKRLFSLIDSTPNLEWLLLTKRPENIKRMIPTTGCNGDCVKCYKDGAACRRRDNVWLGTTVENQDQANLRIPELLKCRDLSPVLFLSCEPLLGPTIPNLIGCPHCGQSKQSWFPNYTICRSCNREVKSPPECCIDWVICGGESGRQARPMHPDWARSLQDHCKWAEVPFFFKQWGEWQPQRRARHSDLSCDSTKQLIVGIDGQITTGFLDVGAEAFIMDRVGKKRAGRLLDGVEFSQFPTS